MTTLSPTLHCYHRMVIVCRHGREFASGSVPQRKYGRFVLNLLLKCSLSWCKKGRWEYNIKYIKKNFFLLLHFLNIQWSNRILLTVVAWHECIEANTVCKTLLDHRMVEKVLKKFCYMYFILPSMCVSYMCILPDFLRVSEC